MRKWFLIISKSVDIPSILTDITHINYRSRKVSLDHTVCTILGHFFLGAILYLCLAHNHLELHLKWLKPFRPKSKWPFHPNVIISNDNSNVITLNVTKYVNQMGKTFYAHSNLPFSFNVGKKARYLFREETISIGVPDLMLSSHALSSSQASW